MLGATSVAVVLVIVKGLSLGVVLGCRSNHLVLIIDKWIFLLNLVIVTAVVNHHLIIPYRYLLLSTGNNWDGSIFLIIENQGGFLVNMIMTILRSLQILRWVDAQGLLEFGVI